MSLNIFLIGPMGTGKTTIGRQLARKLKLEFHDSDRLIEERTGVNIPLIFDLEGERGFRKREKSLIDELSQLDNIVLATGGGAILDDETRDILKQRGRVIYLKSTLKDLVNRTRKDKNRPLLASGNNPKSVLKEMLDIRGPIYEDTADIVIETGHGSIHIIVKAIMQQLEEHSQ